VSGLFRTIRHLAALQGILFILARHDAVFPLRRVAFGGVLVSMLRFLVPRRANVIGLRGGERLALAFQQLGPTFIKLGQALSTRADLVGEEMALDLSSLQDRLPPFPIEAVQAVIEQQLGENLAVLFSSFSPLPVAAASVAQVHFAVTPDGREVAVKILRPGVDLAFARDLDLMQWLSEVVLRLHPPARRLRPIEVVAQLRDSVAFELDLRLEAAAASELAENLRDQPGFRVPAVDWARTAKRVLTTERIYGIPVDERARIIAAGHSPRDIMAKAAEAFFTMIFRDGFFHADLHPGNLFVGEDGGIIAVDFGIMGRLDRKHRYYLADILLAFISGDYAKVATVHFDAGFVPPTESVEAFTQACRSIGEPLLGKPLEQISVARLLAQLFEVTRQFNMQTQPQLFMLQKTLVLAEGLGRILDPSVNMWALARPLIEDWMRVNRSPPARILTAVAEGISGLERLPALGRELEGMLRRLGKDGLRLHDDTVRDMQHARSGFLIIAIPLWLAALALLKLAFLH
jgi:ubiquinone biosynthesis protein